MVYRIYVEKKPLFAQEAANLKREFNEILGIESLAGLRILNRYDVENIDEDLFERVIGTVFSEPQVDDVYRDLSPSEGDRILAVEYLPGQFDQRANSAAECIQLISKMERPDVRTAKVYLLSGQLTDDQYSRIKSYLINPVESREASLDRFETLRMEAEIPTEVEILNGFNDLDEKGLQELLSQRGLAMDMGDLKFCQDYFRKRGKDPTITEIKVIDTYWSDHCRHTTFNTIIDDVEFHDPLVKRAYEDYLKTRERLNVTKPVTLMDIGTIAAKSLKAEGKLEGLDESDEINACTVKIDVRFGDETEKWLLLFKNETHNHPTEIEPFGGAATCIGGAIRDPLSGRSYVYSAMRVTGAADPLLPVSQTMEGKLPQRKIVTTAAAGYSSYGNQIGLATGQVSELYHPGYVAKRMEVGAVVAAAPAENVKREKPAAGDVVILLGGRTGRDGCGGATGSSKSHNLDSLADCGAEVQKGNAPEERKLQRLFRNPEASLLIKRCNDFGAGGVSVAIGELADGLSIDLNAVPKKYEGLDGTELAISESQERMAVVVGGDDADRFMELARQENLEATVVAKVTDEPQLKMYWNGKAIVDISRAFLDTNGAEKHIDVSVEKPIDINERPVNQSLREGSLSDRMKALVSDLNVCSQRGLSERFDSTIGAGTVLMPFGGRYQRTPIQAMVNLISSEKKNADTCSVMSYGFNPYVSSADPYKGAYLAVVESLSKLAATGASLDHTYLSFQEYFEKPGREGRRWGKPMAAVLGAYIAQMELEVAAIGGKDSMSGSFEDIDVPPTLISFAVTTAAPKDIISPEFKGVNHNVFMLTPCLNDAGLPDGESLKKLFSAVHREISSGRILAAYTPGYGGAAEAVIKMSMGNMIGFTYDDSVTADDVFQYSYGSFIVEDGEGSLYHRFKDIQGFNVIRLGATTDKYELSMGGEQADLTDIEKAYEDKLESIYPCRIDAASAKYETFTFRAESRYTCRIKKARPKVLIPVFPGTNCEYDSAKAFEKAGADPEIFVINNLTPDAVSRSVEEFASKIGESQIIFIPGGFSGGDEPDGSGKFITAFFRNGEIKESVENLLEKRDGLMAGICNGFQALIKLGLVPFGRIMDTDESCPTLTFNEIGRHQSKLVMTRIVSDKSPWLSETRPGDIYTVPISHGEGRFVADEELIRRMAETGQIATQYVDFDGKATGNIQFNPNGSYYAIEGITSPDGRVLGKMGHSERVGRSLYKNVPGNYDMGMFRSAVKYFR